MGVTHVEIKVASIQAPTDTRRVDVMVDSGAIFPVLPSSLLAELGIEPLTEEAFFLADGKRITRKNGGAVFRYRGKVGVADALFAEEGDTNLLGATTRESLSLALDPIRRELNPMSLPLGGPRPAR
ncbi:MAG: aspartyl protease [Planctomycetota bacterium]